MSQRARARGLAETLPGATIKHVSADVTLLAGDHVVYADSSGGAVVVTLPPMPEAIGKFYFVRAPSAGTADVSVNQYEGASEVGDFDTDDDHAVFFCTGLAWVVVFSGIT